MVRSATDQILDNPRLCVFRESSETIMTVELQGTWIVDCEYFSCYLVRRTKDDPKLTALTREWSVRKGVNPLKPGEYYHASYGPPIKLVGHQIRRRRPRPTLATMRS